MPRKSSPPRAWSAVAVGAASSVSFPNRAPKGRNVRWDAHHIQLAAAAGFGAAVVSAGRYGYWLSQRRRLPERGRVWCGFASCVLLAFAGGSVSGALLIEALDARPLAAWASAVLLGVSTDLTVTTGPLRLLSLAMRITSRMLDSARTSIDMRESDTSKSSSASDSDSDLLR